MLAATNKNINRLQRILNSAANAVPRAPIFNHIIHIVKPKFIGLKLMKESFISSNKILYIHEPSHSYLHSLLVLAYCIIIHHHRERQNAGF
jgi:hypothetical protein